MAEKKKKKISKDMTFMELMELDPKAGAKLAERGLFCGGCPMAQFETIENGALAHNVPLDKLLKELNEDGSDAKHLDGSSTLSKDGSHSSNMDGSASPEVGDGE